MYDKYNLSNRFQHQKPHKTKPIQTKPNLTSLTLDAKFSAISYPIELKFGVYD